MSDPGRVRLTSWKEIASHLGREVRTVVRWEKERGLPVHRVPGGQGRSVFAFADELDAWAAGENAREQIVPPSVPAAPLPLRRYRPRTLLTAAAGTIMLIATVSAVLALRRPHRDIATIAVGDVSLEAIGPEGQAVWSFPLPGRTHVLVHRQSAFADVNGDGRQDVLASVALAPTPADMATGLLYAIDAEGRQLWQQSVPTGLAFGAGHFDPPWQPDDLMTFSSDGSPLIAWSVHHLTWWPSVLSVFDARGTRLGAFVNAGWMTTSRASRDGRHVIAGGFSNSRHGAAFAVLDARHPDGASPEDAGSPYECRTCPAGHPLHYFVVDWSDVATTLPPDERDVSITVSPATGGIELRAQQRRSVELIVELSPRFDVVRRSAGDGFWEWHARLEREGQLTHDRQHCPFRDGPIVREWTPEDGWRR